MLSILERFFDNFIKWTGEGTKWLTTILVVLIFGDVVFRYLFATSKASVTDLEWHVFALIFLFGASYALQEDQHVRVDVLYTKWSVTRKAWINFLGALFFLLPWCLIVIYSSYQYAGHAFSVRESSPEPGGLPARYLIKGAITVGFALLAIQAISSAIRSLKTILGK